MIDEKAIDRLHKLLAHKESAESIGSIAEAAAFADRINELLIKYNVDMASVRVSEREPEEAIARTRVIIGARRNRRTLWLEELAHAVSRAHMCAFLVVPRSNVLVFVGKTTNREVAVYVFEQLATVALRVADVETRKAVRRKIESADAYRAASQRWNEATYANPLTAAERNEFHRLNQLQRLKGFKQAFYEGFVVEVGRKLAARRKVAESQGEGVALVLVSEAERVQKYIAENVRGKARDLGDPSSFSAEGYEVGKRYGRDTDVMPGIGTAVGQRAISDGGRTS